MQSTESKSKTSASDDSQTGRTLLNLRGMLLRGDFQPGERLSELPLVARLGVSRTPIRLALDRLAHEGLLEASPTGGFVVRAFTIEDIWDAIETRGVLEGAAARLAAERLEHDSELAQLREYRDEMDAMIRHQWRPGQVRGARHRFFRALSGSERSLSLRDRDAGQKLHAAASLGSGERQFRLHRPARWCTCARSCPARPRCSPFLTSTTAPSSRPSSTGKAPAPKPWRANIPA